MFSDDDVVTTHVARLTGLSANTRTWDRVRFDDRRLSAYEFLTARAAGDNGRAEFIMFADNQDGPRAFRDLAVRMAKDDPDFILKCGDVVQNGTPWDYRETLFSPYFGLGNRAAILMRTSHPRPRAPPPSDYLAPLFERMRVQLVFNGHNHLYQFVRRWPEFTVWVTSGGGGGTLESGVDSARVNDG